MFNENKTTIAANEVSAMCLCLGDEITDKKLSSNTANKNMSNWPLKPRSVKE